MYIGTFICIHLNCIYIRVAQKTLLIRYSDITKKISKTVDYSCIEAIIPFICEIFIAIKGIQNLCLYFDRLVRMSALFYSGSN